MKKILPLAITALLVTEPASSRDLLTAYEQALSYDSTLASAEARFRAQKEAIDISKSALLPQVQGTVDYSHTSSELEAQTAFDTTSEYDYRTTTYGLQLSQPLFSAERWFQYDASQFQADTAKAQYNLAQQQLIVDLATAYFDVLRAQDTVITTKATETAIQKQYDQAQERFDVGLIAITEVYETRASYDAAKSNRIAAENQLNVAREQLARLTGEYSVNHANLLQEFPMSRPTPMDANAWETTALSQNWSIQAAASRLDAEDAGLDAVKSRHLPTLDLTATYNETSYGSGASVFTRGSTDTVIGVQLTVPLYEGGGTQASVRQQRSLVTAVEEDLNTARRDVVVNTRSLFLTVNNNIETALALRQTIVSRRSALDATRAGYEVGTRNIVDVLDAEQAYYMALRDYANVRYDYIINSLQLKQTAGTLSPQDLMELNTWLSDNARGIEALANESETIGNPTPR